MQTLVIKTKLLCEYIVLLFYFTSPHTSAPWDPQDLKCTAAYVMSSHYLLLLLLVHHVQCLELGCEPCGESAGSGKHVLHETYNAHQVSNTPFSLLRAIAATAFSAS